MKQALEAVPGVVGVEVLFQEKRVNVMGTAHYSLLIDAVKSAGYAAKRISALPSAASEPSSIVLAIDGMMWCVPNILPTPSSPCDYPLILFCCSLV